MAFILYISWATGFQEGKKVAKYIERFFLSNVSYNNKPEINKKKKRL